MGGASDSPRPWRPGSESCATSSALASGAPAGCGEIIHAGRCSGSGPGSAAETGGAVSRSDPWGHGDQESLAAGCGLARFGTRRGSARSGTGSCSGGGEAARSDDDDAVGTGAGAVCCADASSAAAAGLALTGRASIRGESCLATSRSSPATSTAGALDGTSTAALFAFLGRTLGGLLCHTRADTTMSSFSAYGAIRHQVCGSAMYRSCELTSSGSRLLSITGRVVSHVSTPGGSI
jgi:hypothetical protein